MTPEEIGGLGMVSSIQFVVWTMTRFSRAFLLGGALAYGAFVVYIIITYAAWRAWRRRPIKPPRKLRFLALLVVGFYFLSLFYVASMLIPFAIGVAGFLSPDISRAMSLLSLLGCPAIIVFTLLRAPQLNRGVFDRFLPKRKANLKGVFPLMWLLAIIGSSCGLLWSRTEMGAFFSSVSGLILLLFGFFLLAVSTGCLYQFGILMRAGISDALKPNDT
jgi:hypothetical protein